MASSADASSMALDAPAGPPPTAARSSSSSPVPIASAAPLVPEEEAARAVRKRYEGLAAVRCKAVKGKGAWYWAHLEPIVYHHPDTGLPRAVKLRCCLCGAEFSASNPSRTASEHLKRGTCPNFSSSAPPSALALAAASSSPRPVSSLPPPHHHCRKRPSLETNHPLAIVDYYSDDRRRRQQQQHREHLVLSGGKEDLEALAMLEDSVKRLKCGGPHGAGGASLGRAQAEVAMAHLADWLYESCGAVSPSSLGHPKLRAFLRQVGLPDPPPSPADLLLGPRLSARHDEALRESDARVRDAPFFQLSSHGWNPPASCTGMVSLSLNLPNGTGVFQRAVFTDGKCPPKLAQDVLWETIGNACGGDPRRCAGIVSTKFKSKALRDLERRNRWMVNLPCQLHGVHALVKDLGRELPLFRATAGRCRTVAHFFSTDPNASGCLQEYALREQLDRVGVVPASFNSFIHRNRSITNDEPANVVRLMEDVMSYARELHQIVVDEPGSGANRFPVDVAKTVLDVGFWNELEAALSLVKLVREMAAEIDAERPFVGQCLPMWDELRLKVKGWCAKYDVAEGPVEEVVERRFRKNYHPAWSAAFVLDPLYLMKDANGKYLPPFKCLTPEQVEDVHGLISRLVPPEEAPAALMELMKWRSEGLERDYALAVQVRQHDPATGKMKIANPLGSRLVWESHLREFKSLGKVAVRLIFLHATTCGFKFNTSFLRWIGGWRRWSTVSLERVQKIVFIAANEKLKSGDFLSEEEKDAKLFCSQDNDVSEEDFMETTAPL